MFKKDFLRVSDYSRRDMELVFAETKKIKDRFKKGLPHAPLAGKTLGMIFQKSSTRTRVSFEAGMYQLGGYPLFLNSSDLQLKRGETIGDTARVLSRYLDALMIRTYSHRDVEELASKATIPVINGLTDSHHPCQIMADIYTLLEKRGRVKGLTLAWIGDGNNVLNSWIDGAPLAGMNLRIAVPKGYEPDPVILKEGGARAEKEKTTLELFNDPLAAAEDADVIYTDVWASMGQEAEKEKRLKDFRDFQVNAALLSHASRDVLVMHCLPAHRGEEITDEVVDGPHSIVFDEAENRLHVQKAILALHILRKSSPVV